MNISPPIIELRTPKQTRLKLSHGISNAQEMNAWLETLPKVNTGEIAQSLYSMTLELNHLQTDAYSRFQLLEEVRPVLHYVCRSLSRYFLNQPIILNTEQVQILELCQRLQDLLASAYIIVLRQALDKKLPNAPLRQKSLHRSLAELSSVLSRSYQLYSKAREYLWKDLNQLYLIAEYYKDLSEKIYDPISKKETSIKSAYSKNILVSTANPNKLRQQEIMQLFNALDHWAECCEIKTITEAPSPYILNLNSDLPVLLAKWDKEVRRGESKNLRYVHFSQVAELVKMQLEQKSSNTDSDISLKVLSRSLLNHLHASWNNSAQRKFARTPHSGSLSLVLGIKNIHVLLSKLQDDPSLIAELEPDTLNAFLQQKQSSSFKVKDEIKAGGDVWSHKAINSPQASQEADHQESRPEEYIFQCAIEDTSPEGYCVNWPGNIPLELKAGSLIAIKEPAQKKWCIASAQWLKKSDTSNTQIGVKLLAPSAQAINIKAFHADGAETRFMRALRLPEIATMGKPQTLIMAHLAFREKDRVLIKQNHQEFRGALQHELFSTANFSQFAYKILQ